MKHTLLTFFLLNSYHLSAMETLKTIQVQLPCQKELRIRFYANHFTDFENDMWPSFKFCDKKENPIAIADQINNEFTLWIKQRHNNDPFIAELMNTRRTMLVIVMLADHEELLLDMEKSGYFKKYLSKQPKSKAMTLFEKLAEAQEKTRDKPLDL